MLTIDLDGHGSGDELITITLENIDFSMIERDTFLDALARNSLILSEQDRIQKHDTGPVWNFAGASNETLNVTGRHFLTDDNAQAFILGDSSSAGLKITFGADSRVDALGDNQDVVGLNGDGHTIINYGILRGSRVIEFDPRRIQG